MRIVPRLHVEQGFHPHPKGFFDPQGHFRGKSGLSIHEVGEGCPAHVQSVRGLANGQGEFLKSQCTEQANWNLNLAYLLH